MIASKHARNRISERNNRRDASFLMAYRRAVMDGNYFVEDHPMIDGRLVVYFSSNKKYLYRIVISKKDAAIITSLPVSPRDLDKAEAKGILDERKI